MRITSDVTDVQTCTILILADEVRTDGDDDAGSSLARIGYHNRASRTLSCYTPLEKWLADCIFLI